MTIQVTNADKVLLGHGSYLGGAQNFELPKGFELIILQPVGYTLGVDVAQKLIAQQAIDHLVLKHDNGSGDSVWNLPGATYQGGNLAPNLVLHDLAGTAVVGSSAANVVLVRTDTSLSDLVKTLKPTRLFWCACANQVNGNRARLS
jgi:hypothetical protein